MADCRLRPIAALTGLGRIADCTLGAMQCKDPQLQLQAVFCAVTQFQELSATEGTRNRCLPEGFEG
eukprot:1410281-Alexandrium_andersonii.AAC.1